MQYSEGIYISQRKFVREILERFGIGSCNFVSNPIIPRARPTKDIDGVAVNETEYKHMVGCLMYLTVTRPDLMYVSKFMADPICRL